MLNLGIKRFFETMEAQCLMLTYNDVRLRTRYSNVLPGDTHLASRFSRRISLKVPIASSPMDTVTTAKMAIGMAMAGGIGIIHRGFTPEAQAHEVGRVKHHLHGLIDAPITASPLETIAGLKELRQKKQYEFHTFPVVDERGILLGLLTRNDFDFCVDNSLPTSVVMTPFSELKVAHPGISALQAFRLMREFEKKVLPIVHADRMLAGMYVLSDIQRILSNHLTHNVDSNGQLIVGAAVGVGEGALLRAELLSVRGCDVFHIDSAHGDSRNVIETIRLLKAKYPAIDVVAGNVSNGESALRLADAGADGILVGQGGGSICSTRIVAGVGMPQVSALYECITALDGKNIPVIADGGINSSGDITIALALGAESVMIGRLLAGTEESPGETRIVGGMQVKDYRGMGSLGAMRESRASRERYGQSQSDKLVPEGVEAIVPFRGAVADVLAQYTGGIRAGMGYIGAATLKELRQNALLFRITNAGLVESHPHDVTMTAMPPNYSA